MNIARMFGFGENKLFAEGQAVEGTVTAVKKCWWLKVNTKAVRVNGLDGAKFPHIIYFTYIVEEREFLGGRYVSWAMDAPYVNDRVQVYVDRKDPAKYAVKL